ncbi:MAG: alanine/ornithine racemase family PLP-dependent enzyme [bacterium]
MYPRLNIDLRKLHDNAVAMRHACVENGIDRAFLVVKVLAGDIRAVASLADTGFSHVADSRMENLIRFRSLPLPKALIRLPMIEEAERVVRYADLSLNSELTTIRALSRAAVKQNRIHAVLLMFDLGDLREGRWFEAEYLSFVRTVQALPNIRIAGIGTNLTCYGGVLPDSVNLGRLVVIKQQIEAETGIFVDLVSGGNSSSVHLLGKGVIPPEVNHLRLGEVVFLGRETAYGQPVPGLHRDVFVLEAQLIEVQQKPSKPVGVVGMNSFGEEPIIKDHGMMRRGLVAIGRQDVEPGDLQPRDPGVKIIGASSDHLIVDLHDVSCQVGDTLAFDVNYPGLLRLMTSAYVHKSHRG